MYFVGIERIIERILCMIIHSQTYIFFYNFNLLRNRKRYVTEIFKIQFILRKSNADFVLSLQAPSEWQVDKQAHAAPRSCKRKKLIIPTHIAHFDMDFVLLFLKKHLKDFSMAEKINKFVA